MLFYHPQKEVNIHLVMELALEVSCVLKLGKIRMTTGKNKEEAVK